MDSEVIQKSNLIRKWCLISTTEAGSGHPTSCLSAADITTVLFNSFYTYDLKNPHNLTNDRLIFSKGHAAPLLYTLYAVSDAFPLEHLKTLRKIGSDLEGHPTPNFRYTETATGSLGQGLSVGAGMAYVLSAQVKSSPPAGGLKVQSLPKVYVLLGDGEMAEGSVWEAANFASYYKLHNLIAIVDVNRLGQSQETMFGVKADEYQKRFNAFGWETILIDGHNFDEIEDAFNSATQNKSEKPFAIVAKTKKGKGISFLEDNENYHGKAVKKEDLSRALLELGDIDEKLRFKLRVRELSNVISYGLSKAKDLTDVSDSLTEFTLSASNVSQNDNRYALGQEIATREVYGTMLAELGNTNPLIYALDGDVKNSTSSQDFKKAHPDRFIECFIAEQNMVGVALGLSRLGKIPFVSTFAAFLTRAFDQIRMSVLSDARITFVGSHSGVSIGEDGSSQMGLEDIAMFGTLPNSVILHPSDAVSTIALMPQLVAHKGISYLRTLRPKTSVLYESSEDFKIGGSKILRFSKDDLLTVVACGITVYEALKAYEILKQENILIRIVDCYSLKPIDKKTIEECSNETRKKVIITVEDHFEHGGLGDFVLVALSHTGAYVEKMAVTKISHSGTKDELLDRAGINAKHIVEKVKTLI